MQNPPANTTGGGDTWTVMLYQDADDKILEEDIFIDLNEVERIGSSDKVNIVAQMDRYKGGFSGDGNWTGARRFYVTRDNDLERINSQVVGDLGEVNMSDGQTLIDFVTWAVENYPADKYALILSDHGMGWPGGWSDPDPRSSGDRSIPLAAAIGDQLYLMELDQALGEIRATTGIDKFELVGLDACLMSHMEVFNALQEHARYGVASQETEPALGWAYTSFLDRLVNNPAMNGAGLGTAVVDTYIRDDQRIVDDRARQQLVGGARASAAQVAQQLESNVTLAAVDLGQVPALNAAVNQLALALQNVDQRAVAQARGYAQPFTSIFGSDVPASYIDLGNFSQIAAQSSRDPQVAAASQAVMDALSQAVIRERHGSKKSGATGFSIYFPNSQLYRNPAAGPQSYTAIADRFAANSLWDDYLAFHYTGRRFEAGDSVLVAPDRNQPVEAPGAGQISLSPVELSADVAAPGQPVLMSSVVRGENIGHIYFFAGYQDREANSIYVADSDYLTSDDTREVGGVYFPDWGEGDFNLEFEWEPVVFALNDGRNTVQALLSPQSYGAEAGNAVYTVDGTYTYADGEQRAARLYLSDGELRNVYGFTGDAQSGAPREILPQPGDRFTVAEQWYDLDSSGQLATPATQDGGTITFGNAPVTWELLDAAAGNYVIGFIAEDLDGNRTESYAPVTVR
ncbi:MAG: clostripain-related cysteine peptidase [Caldilineales bacterium]